MLKWIAGFGEIGACVWVAFLLPWYFSVPICFTFILTGHTLGYLKGAEDTLDDVKNRLTSGDPT